MFCGRIIHGERFRRSCNARLCRTMYWYWYGSECGHGIRWCPYGPQYHLALVVEFLRRMAAPRNERDAKFAKRWAHRIGRPHPTP